MAKIDFDGVDKYASILADLARDVEAICKAAVYDGAAVVADSVRAEYEHIEHPYAEGHDLIDHMTLAKMRNDNGYVNTKLMFGGYLKNGAPAPLVARVLESGNSHQSKKPFVRKGVNRAKTRAQAAMAAQLDKQIASRTKGD